MPRTGRPREHTIPSKEELEELYLKDRQNLRQSELATHYHVSRDLIKEWLRKHGIEKNPEKRNATTGTGRRAGRPPSDPKRVSWLNEYEEAPPMRPDVVVRLGSSASVAA